MSQLIKNKSIIFLIVFIFVCAIITGTLIYLTNKGIITLPENEFIANETKEDIKPDKLGIKTLEDKYTPNPLKITTETYTVGEKVEPDFYPIEAYYVQISGLKDTSIQDKINKEIKDQALSLADENELNKENVSNIYVYTNCMANFSNVLSISIYRDIVDKNGNVQSEGNFIGLNYNLKTGEHIEFTNLFTNDAGTKNIISYSAYNSFAGEYLYSPDLYEYSEDIDNTIWDGDMNKVDYSSVEDRVFKVLAGYDRNNDYPFYFNEKYIYVNINNEKISIEMRNFYNQIAIYNRYAAFSDLFEEEPEDELFVFFSNYTEGVLYKKIDKINDNLFLDVNLVNWSDPTNENGIDIKKYVDEIEAEIENCKSYLEANENEAIVLAICYELTNSGEPDENGKIEETINYCKATMTKDYFNSTYFNKILDWKQTDLHEVEYLEYSLVTLLLEDKEEDPNIKVTTDYKADKVYSIETEKQYLYNNSENKNSDNSGIKLLEYDNTNEDYAEIYFILYDYETEPSYYYTVQVKDSNNKNIIFGGKNEEKIMGGVVTKVKIQKVELYGIINFTVFEKKGTNSTTNSANIQINLPYDLTEKIKIEQDENIMERSLGGVSFKYIDSDDVYFSSQPSTHEYSQKFLSEDCSLPIKIQYGNYLETQDHIELFYEINVNNLNLDDAFTDLALITQTFGQYGLVDVYGMNLANGTGNSEDVVIITFDEMLKLCNGQAIEKDGVTYTKDSFEGFAEPPMKKDGNVTIGKGINAIKYHYENGEEYEHYMFINDDKIYQIKIPLDERITTEVQQFMDSLEIK